MRLCSAQRCRATSSDKSSQARPCPQGPDPTGWSQDGRRAPPLSSTCSSSASSRRCSPPWTGRRPASCISCGSAVRDIQARRRHQQITSGPYHKPRASGMQSNISVVRWAAERCRAQRRTTRRKEFKEILCDSAEFHRLGNLTTAVESSVVVRARNRAQKAQRTGSGTHYGVSELCRPAYAPARRRSAARTAAGPPVKHWPSLR